jgi:hypothetical protein
VRRLLALGAAGAVVWRLVSRRRGQATAHVLVGYDDGSTLSLDPGSPERELLVDAASEALRG